MNTIVTFIAFSELTPRLIEQTERFAKILDAQVILIHLVPSEQSMIEMGGLSTNEMGSISSMTLPNIHKEIIDAHYKRLSEFAERLNHAGVKTQTEQLMNADIETAMVACGQWKADLIIVGSNHHNALYNTLIGSFRDKLLKAAHCPVLVVPEIAVQ